MRYRLIKPDWGKALQPNGKPNLKYVRDIQGPDTYEGEDYSEEFLQKKNSLGYNVYYFPNSTSKKLDHSWMNGRDVDTFHWAFVDMDLKDKKYASKEAFLERLSQFALKPTYVVDSGNGIHAYWLVSDIEDHFVLMALQKSLLREFDTDQSIWTPLQLMRCPGYKNTKDPENFKDALRLPEWESDGVCTVAELTALLPELSQKDLNDIQLHADKLEGKVTVEIQDSIAEGLPKKFQRLLDKENYIRRLFEDPEGTKGDRSAADMSLANLLIAKFDFDRDETLQVLLNTQKALSRQGQSRWDYAMHTLEKAARDCTPLAVQNAEQVLANPESEDDLGARVNGPYFLDALHKPWRKKQMLGLIAGSGVGKTALTLKIFEQFIKNNQDNDDIFFFFSLEMTVGEVLDRWKALVGEDESMFKRLFVISQKQVEDAEGDLGPNVQTIYRLVRATSIQTGKKVGVVAIDHLDAMSGDVNLKMAPTFGAERSAYVERKFGANGLVLNKDGICQSLKRLAQLLDCFLIVQSQTTKDKDADGSKPIGKNAAFGSSKFEWYCDYVVGVWRPLNGMMEKCREANLFVTAYQYAKIREQKPDKDDIQLLEAKLIKFIPEKEDFVGLDDKEAATFHEILDAAIKLREVQEKNKMKKYGKAPVRRLRNLIAEAKKGN